MRFSGLLAAALVCLAIPASADEELRPFVILGDAIPDSLTGKPGDPAPGRAIVANRQLGLCLLCHSGPFPEERFQGNLAILFPKQTGQRSNHLATLILAVGHEPERRVAHPAIFRPELFN